MSASEGELIRAVVPLKVQGYGEICGKEPCGDTWISTYIIQGNNRQLQTYSLGKSRLATNSTQQYTSSSPTYLLLVLGLCSNRAQVGKLHSSSLPSSTALQLVNPPLPLIPTSHGYTHLLGFSENAHLTRVYRGRHRIKWSGRWRSGRETSSRPTGTI